VIGAVHAIVGAAVGLLFKRKSAAFAAGVASHLITDALPHDDLDPKLEIPLLAVTLAGIAKWRGIDSTEFWGALGGIAPDAEHGLLLAGLVKQEQEVFPTHIRDGIFHGRERGERWSQLLIAGASLVAVALSSTDCGLHTGEPKGASHTR
jgi:hypothetical protein